MAAAAAAGGGAGGSSGANNGGGGGGCQVFAAGGSQEGPRPSAEAIRTLRQVGGWLGWWLIVWLLEGASGDGVQAGLFLIFLFDCTHKDPCSGWSTDAAHCATPLSHCPHLSLF